MRFPLALGALTLALSTAAPLAAHGAKLKIPGTELVLEVGAGREVASRSCVTGTVTRSTLRIGRAGARSLVNVELMTWKDVRGKRCFGLATNGASPTCWKACAPSVSAVMDALYGATVVRLGLAAASALILVAVPLTLFGAGI